MTSDFARHQVWALLHYVSDAVVRCEEEAFMRQGGISYQQFLVLMAIESSDVPVTAAALARHLQRNPNSVSMILDRMEKLSLVRRSRSRKDRRLVFVTATAQGKERLRKAIGVGAAVVQRVAGGLSDAEINELLRLLGKVGAGAVKEAGLKIDLTEMAHSNAERMKSLLA